MSSLQILIQDQIAYSRWNFCFMKGFSELDDVMHNMVGCLIGYGAYWLIRLGYEK